MFHEILEATNQSLIMIGFASLVTIVFGLGFAIALKVLEQSVKLPSYLVTLFEGILSLPEKIPYLVLMVLLIPITTAISKGQWPAHIASVIPLSIALVPFFMLRVYRAFNQIPQGVIDAAVSCGASIYHQIMDVYIPESRKTITDTVKQTVMLLIGYSTIAGALGAGGLGQYALQFSAHFDIRPLLMVALILTVLSLVVETTSRVFQKD